MIHVTFTETQSLLHRHKTFIKINNEKRHHSVLDNQFWLIDFPDSANRSAEEAASMYYHWLEDQLLNHKHGPVATKLNQLAELIWYENEVKIMVFPGARHGGQLEFVLTELVYALGPAHEPTPSALLYRSQMPDEEFAKRDSLAADPDDETIWTTQQLRDERIVRIIGNYDVKLGVRISESEALVPGHDLVLLKEDRWFYDAAAASDDERLELQKALYQFHHEEWNINERFVSRPVDRYDEAAVALFTDLGLQAFDEGDKGLLIADADQEAAERTVIGWYHKRDLARTPNLYGLGILVNRYSQSA